MNLIITVSNNDTRKEQEFNLPFNSTEVEEFISGGNYTITEVEDNYHFFTNLCFEDTPIPTIIELVELLENNTDIEENCAKLQYHYEQNIIDIENLVSCFSEIVDKYYILTDAKYGIDWILD